MTETELVMSDMPWAMAWYGRRQSVWTTLNIEDRKRGDDFFTVSTDVLSDHADLAFTPASKVCRIATGC